MKVKVGLAQIIPRLGDLPANLEMHLRQIEEAAALGVELLVFPELSLTGYQLKDMAYSLCLQPEATDPVFAQLLQASRHMDLVVGFVELDRRQRFYNASAYLSQGELLHLHRKVYLPTYGVFEEGRYFAPGNTLRAFDTSFGRAGLLICEDYWHVSAAHLLWLDGADFLIFTSASPSRALGAEDHIGSAQRVQHMIHAYASIFTNFIIHCNRTGVEDEIAFWGGSAIIDPAGALLAQGPYNEEALVTAQMDLNQLRRTRIKLPLLRDERMALTIRELQRIADRRQR